MRLMTGFLSLLLPALAGAQGYPGMSEADMQKMMQQMQEMQTCMQGIDQSGLKAFEQRAGTMEAKVKSLCAEGKRNAAEKEVMAFAREIAANPDIQKMRKCSEKMQDVMPQMPYMNHTGEPDKSAVHVCDE